MSKRKNQPIMIYGKECLSLDSACQTAADVILAMEYDIDNHESKVLIRTIARSVSNQIYDRVEQLVKEGRKA